MFERLRQVHFQWYLETLRDVAGMSVSSLKLDLVLSL